MPVRHCSRICAATVALPAAAAPLRPGPQQRPRSALTREDEDGKAACFRSRSILETLRTARPSTLWKCGAHTRDWKTFLTWRPAALACDLHPSYPIEPVGTRAVREAQSALVEVQHHHAHIASVMAGRHRCGTSLRLARARPGRTFTDGWALAPAGPFGAASFLSRRRTGTGHLHLHVPGHFPVAPHLCAAARRNAFALLSSSIYSNIRSAAGLLGGLDEQTRGITTGDQAEYRHQPTERQ